MLRMASRARVGNRQVGLRVLAMLLLLTLALSTVLPASAGNGVWTQQDLVGQVVTAVAVDPTNPNIIFAGTRGSGIFRSVDRGQTWTQINSGLANLFVNDLQIDPQTPTIVYAGTGQSPALGDAGHGLYRSTNRGDSWVRQLDAHVASIAIDPQNPSVVYAAGAPPVFKSIDRGVTWTASFTDIANTDLRGIDVNPANPSVLLAGGATEGGGGNLFRSTNAGASWTRVVTAESGQLAITDVAFAASGNVALATAIGNVLRSVDGGVTWATATSGQDFLTMRVNPVNTSEVFLGTAGGGVLRSTNAGITFTQLDTTLGNRTVHAVDIDRASPQTVYAGTDNGIWAFTFPAAPPITPQTTWFFAEGSTQPPFDTWLLVQNATAQPANVRFTFFLQPAGTVVREFTVGPTSRFSVFANQVIPNVAFSTRIESNVPVFAERAMYVGFDGHAVTGIAAPNRLWLFAEGATVQPFHTWLLLQNPNNSAAPTTVTYLLESGQTVTQRLTLPPNSRTSIFVNQVLPNAAFSSRVESEQPIIVERAMFRFPGNAATGVAGVNAPSRNWFFAEGRTTFRGMRADTFLLLQNPNNRQVTANITLFSTDGRVSNFAIPLVPTSRRTIFLNPLFSGSFGIRVEAEDGIIAERSVFFGNEPLGAYATQGATELRTVWNLAEGETRAPFDELISILNPQGQTMNVHIDFQLENGQVIGRDFTIGANSKLEILVDDFIPGANSARVTTSQPSVVERTMFIFKLGDIGAHNTIGIASP